MGKSHNRFFRQTAAYDDVSGIFEAQFKRIKRSIKIFITWRNLNDKKY